MISEEISIPESVADFIQGRVPKKFGTRNYMPLKRKAVQFYPRYSGYVRGLREKAFGDAVLPSGKLIVKNK